MSASVTTVIMTTGQRQHKRVKLETKPVVLRSELPGPGQPLTIHLRANLKQTPK